MKMIKRFLYLLIIELYKLLPFKKQFCLLFRNSDYISDKFFNDFKFHDSFTVNGNGHSFTLFHFGDTIENLIFWKGINNGWEKVSIAIWEKLAKESDVIIDIGANTGIYSLLAASVNPKAQIFAFEPSIIAFNKFKKNIALNNFQNIEPHRIAISNKNGEATFYDFAGAHQYSASLHKEMFDEKVERIEIKVPVQTLKEFIEKNNIKKVDLMKIDVEMHEVEVIEGMKEYLIKYKPTILIEVLNNEIGELLEKKFENSDYLFFSIDEINAPKNTKKISKSEHYNYLLCSKTVAQKLNLTISTSY